MHMYINDRRLYCLGGCVVALILFLIALDTYCLLYIYNVHLFILLIVYYYYSVQIITMYSVYSTIYINAAYYPICWVVIILYKKETILMYFRWEDAKFIPQVY